MSISNLFVPNNFELFAAGITFPNPNSSIFNYYENALVNADYTDAFIFTEPNGIQLTRIGNMVFCSLSIVLKTVTAAVSGNITIGTIPTRFCPTNLFTVFRVPVIVSNNTVFVLGSASVDINGFINIHSDADFGKFLNGIVAGIGAPITLMWPIL